MIESLLFGHSEILDFSSAYHMHIHGQIENKNLTALIDTGAPGFTLASRSLCYQLKISPIPHASAITLLGSERKRESYIT